MTGRWMAGWDRDGPVQALNGSFMKKSPNHLDCSRQGMQMDSQLRGETFNQNAGTLALGANIVQPCSFPQGASSAECARAKHGA